MSATESAIVDAITAAAVDPHADRGDILYAMVRIADGAELSASAGARPSTEQERHHARRLVLAFGLELRPDNAGHSKWTLSPYAAQLHNGFGPPGQLEDAPDDALQLWAAYANAELPPLAVAHLADLLASRHSDLPTSADRAIEANLDLPGVIADVYAADQLARALELAVQFNRLDLQPTVENALIEHARRALDREPQLGTFVRSVRPLVSRNRRTEDVTALLDDALQVWDDDPWGAGAVHELRRELAPDGTARVLVERDHIQMLLDVAGRQDEGLLRLRFLQDAYDAAVTFGHGDLSEQAKADMRAIPRDSFTFERISLPDPFPPGYREARVRIIVGDDDIVLALRRLVGSCPTGDTDDVQARAEAGEATGTFEAIFDTMVLNAELMPKDHHAGGDLAAAVARLRDISMGLLMPILASGLMRIPDHYVVDDPDLPGRVAERGQIDVRSAGKLVRALRCFWREDFEGAAYIGVTLVEGLLRERLLALGEDPYRAPVTGGDQPGKYATLWTLIDRARKAGLNASWMDFLQYALCDPSIGPNIRNELLHGAVMVEPDPGTASTVLVAALYLAIGIDAS